ncbi:hypothetical protein SESBI_15429 [Sesbania bispinosa]|nr:hypothetical protein SESBI_15429 [Sesbania bispinosa]
MASKQQAKLVEKLAKRIAAATKKMKETRDGPEHVLQAVERPRVKRLRVNTTPAEEIPESQAPTKQPIQIISKGSSSTLPPRDDKEEEGDPDPEGVDNEEKGSTDAVINTEDVPPSGANE